MSVTSPLPPQFDAEPGVDPGLLHQSYYYMALSRAIDTRLWLLSRQGQAHFVITPTGHEAAQVGSALAMQLGHDYFVPYYRSMAACLAAGMTARDMLLHARGAVEDPSSAGRQMFGHFSRRDLHIVSGSSSVGTQMLHAAGLALAFRNRHEDRVTITYFGEGGTSEGDWHEAMNFAAIHRLKVLFFCENNKYAISVPEHRQIGPVSVAEKSRAYGIPGIQVDGNDLLAVYQATHDARQQMVGDQGGPILIEALTYRLSPHSNADDDSRYRDPQEVQAARERDPIPRFLGWMMAQNLITSDQQGEIDARIKAEVDDATEYAYSRPDPAEEYLYRQVYAPQEP